MAGLLDYGSQPSGGGGLLDFIANDPGARMGLAMLAGSSPKYGRGLMQALQSQDDFKQQAMQQQILQAQLDDRTAQTQARQAQAAAEVRKQQALPTLFAQPEGGGDQAGGAIGQPGGLNWMRGLQAGYSPDQLMKMAELQNIGKQEVARTLETTDPQGRPITVQLDKFGNRIGDGMGAWKSPITVNQGDKTTFVDPATMQARGSLNMNMSPGERDAAARGWANNALTRQRLEFDMGGGADVAPSQAGFVKQFGKPPAGYRWKPDGALEAIPGGPTDIKAGEAGAKAEQRAAAAGAAADNVLEAVKEAKDLVGLNTTGPGSVIAKIPGTDARDLSAKLETIKANLGFDRLQQMRDMSPTGGALGAVAVQELTALQSTVASLDQAQSPSELKKSLERIDKHYNKWLETTKGGKAGGASGSWDEKSGKPAKTVVKTGMYGGRRVVQYSDGSVDYAN